MSQRKKHQIENHLKSVKLDEISGKDCFYRRTSQDYNPDWILQRAGYRSLNFQESLKNQKVPRYSEVGKESEELKSTYQILKNQTIGAKYGQREDPLLNPKIDELQKTRFKIDNGTVLSKDFAFQKASIKYPDHGMLNTNVLYHSEYQQIGKFIPNQAEIINKFYPRDCTFTKASTGNYRNLSLNNAWTYSKVHPSFNEF